MLFKIITVFLLAMLLVGMIGKVMFPGAADRAMRRATLRKKACKTCGRPLIGKTCDCGKDRA